jgi:hypothetical protein
MVGTVLWTTEKGVVLGLNLGCEQEATFFQSFYVHAKYKHEYTNQKHRFLY